MKTPVPMIRFRCPLAPIVCARLGQRSEVLMPPRLYAMTCGRLVGRLKDMIEGEDGPVALPRSEERRVGKEC